MRKLLLCSLLYFSISTTFSQNIQLTNGGSTTVSGSFDAAPISAYFEYMRFQVVYTAAEINAAGITGSKTLTGLGWYINTAPGGGALPSYTIRMANTSATNSAAHDATAVTEVYSANYTPVAGGFDMLTLNGSFVWDGTSNILVDVCFGAAPYVSPYGDVRTYAASTTSGSRRVRCDGCGSQCTANTNTTNSFKPQVSLTFAPPPACPVPTVNVVPGSTTAALSWGSIGGATGYEWAVTTSAIPPASGTATVGTTASATGLTPATVYYAHVRTNCGGGLFSNWSSNTFTTLCTSANIPYSQNFDGVTAPALPTCIIVENVNGSNTWSNLATPAAVVIGAPNSMVYAYNTVVAADDWFYLQGLNLTGGTTYRLTFSWKSNPSFPERFEVKYGTAANAAAMTTGTLYTNTNAASSTVVTETIDFTPASTGIFFVGFHCNSVADQDFLAIDNITVNLPPLCGAPTALTATPTGTATTADLTWNAPTVGTPTGYEWAVTTSVTPPATGTATAGTTATATGLIPNTLYYLHVRTNCGGAGFSSWATISFNAFINDIPCGAIELTLGGPTDCGNTTTATATGDPALVCSTPNNTVWYKYIPGANGPVNVRMSRNGGPTGQLNAWVQFYTAAGTCPSLVLTQLNASCLGNADLTVVADDTLTSPTLTAGVTYYIMIDGFGGTSGAYCINLLAPPLPPSCVTNILPVNGATGVLIPGGLANISWNASPTATSYDIFFGTANPPTVNIGNVAVTNANITGLNYNTTYYWYVVPRNTGGPATGCNTNTTSFTTENPNNCIPLYTTGCTLADSLTYFSLKGNAGSVLYNNSGATCNANPRAYSDYTAVFAPVTMSINNTYSGKMRTGDANDYATIWIDGNDNGFFEDSERLLDNLKIGTTEKLYSIYIPATTPLGTHRLRVRVIYSGIKPTTVTHPCNVYTWGETEDYTVTITNVGDIRSVATGIPGSCQNVAETTIGPNSNNSISIPVYLVDSLNNYICAIYPNGNNLGLVQANFYVHNGPVRQDVTGRYYLDRNLSIGTEFGASLPYNLRFFYRNSELNALIAQPGSGVTSHFDLVMTKTNGPECVTQYVQQSPTFHNPTGFGSYSGDRLLDFTGLTSFSRFFLHGGSSVLIPVNLSNIRGEITGISNTIYWTTATETNNHKFIVERSVDGINFTAIGEVASRAVNGNSSTVLSYSFIDANPVQGKQFYRLQMLDNGGRASYSQIVTLRRGAGKLEIVDVRPNPTNGTVYFNILGTNSNVNIAVRDFNGKEVIRKNLVQSNNFSIDLSKLSGGVYILEVVEVKNGEKAVFKVIKD